MEGQDFSETLLIAAINYLVENVMLVLEVLQSQITITITKDNFLYEVFNKIDLLLFSMLRMLDII